MAGMAAVFGGSFTTGPVTVVSGASEYSPTTTLARRMMWPRS